MSTENKDRNMGNQPGTNGDDKNGKVKKDKPDLLIVRGFRWCKQKVTDGIEVLKDHPVAIALTAFGGSVVGGVAGYKLAETVISKSMPAVCEAEQTPMIPEPEHEEEEETANKVEYVDIPQRSTEEAE